MKTKIISLGIAFFFCYLLQAAAQNQVRIKLSSSQIQNLRVQKSETDVRISVGNRAIDNLLSRFKFTAFYQSYPLAKLFNHPASERVSQLYTVETNEDADNVVRELRNSKLFEYVVKIEDPKPLYTPNDFGLVDPPGAHGNQWYLTNIKAPEAWDISQGSSSIKIAIIDNGFILTHEDLANQIVYQDNVPTAAHGTQTSGVAAAQTDNGIGISGIGFNSKLMLYSFSDSYTKMMNASLNGAKVVNCSFIATCSYDSYHQDIVNMVVSNGTTVIGAAGNGNAGASCSTDGYVYPASYDNVISVGGTDLDSYFDTNITTRRFTFNDKVDLTAPGWYLMTTSSPNNNSYGSNSGTSFSAPLVSGTVALMLAVKSCLSTSEIDYILKKTADQSVFNYTLHPENQPFAATSGAGRLDANAALQTTQTWPASLASYASISGPQLLCTSATFTLNNVPNGMGIQWVPNANVTITSGQGTPSAVVSKISNGPGSVYAIITSGCSENVTIPAVNFHVGPYSSGDYPITGPSAVCKNQYVYVNTVDLVGATNYNWLWPSSWTYVSGQGTRYLALRTTSSSTTGAVSVRVDNTCGAGGSYNNKVIAVNSCGGFFAMYPNPAARALTVEKMPAVSPESGEYVNFWNGSFTVELRNSTGNLEMQASSDKNKLILDTGHLPEGTYYLTIKDATEMITEQIIIRR